MCCLCPQVPTCSRSYDLAGLQSILCVSLLTANADTNKIEMIVMTFVFITNISSSEHIILDKVVCYHFEPIILRVQLVCHLWPQVLSCSGVEIRLTCIRSFVCLFHVFEIVRCEWLDRLEQTDGAKITVSLLTGLIREL